MIKHIFLHISGSAGDESALDSAIALGSAHGARVSALITTDIPTPLYSEVGFAANEMLAKDYNEAKRSATALAEQTRQRLEQSGVEAEVTVIDTSPANRAKAIATHARYSDVSIMGGRDGAGAAVTFETLLMESGRPVIVVPPGAPLRARPRHVVLAWQASREATRAVHDALPLLDPGTKLDVLVIGSEESEEDRGERPGQRIAEILGQLGLHAQIVAVPKQQGHSDGKSLLDYMEASNADLLVMGGYGHSPMRELLLGGTTRTVLNGLTKPVFFEH